MAVSVKLTEEDKKDIIDGLFEKMSEKQPQEKKIKTYSVAEVAKMLKVNQSTITRHIRYNLLKAHKPGKNYIIKETDLKTYINGH